MQLPVLMPEAGTLLDPFSKTVFIFKLFDLSTVNKQGINYQEKRQENKCMPERKGKVSLRERILSLYSNFL